MKTTAPSTVTTDRLVELLLPSEHAELLRRACNCYSNACAKAAKARGARTAEREALVLTAIHAKKARLVKEPRHAWTSILMQHYFDKRGITIDEELVRRVVKQFPGF